MYACMYEPGEKKSKWFAHSGSGYWIRVDKSRLLPCTHACCIHVCAHVTI